MTALISSMGLSSARHREFIENLTSYMRDQGFPPGLQDKLRGYFDFVRSRFQDVLSVESLPLALQSLV